MRLRTLSSAILAAAFSAVVCVSIAAACPECPLTVSGFPAGLNAERFVLADFDGDGLLDVVAVQPDVPYGNGGAALLLGARAAADTGYVLGTPVRFETGDDLEIVTADFDADGKPDIAILDHHARLVRVRRGLGAGLFAAPVAYDTQDDPAGLTAADVDGDGAIDLLVANRGVSPQLLMNTRVAGHPTGTFVSRPGPYTPYRAVSLAVADLNGDRIQDIVVEEEGDTAVAIYRGTGTNGKWDGDWASPVRYKMDDQPTFVRILDLDGDGILDVVAAAYHGHATVLRGLGGGAFQDLGEALHAKAPFGDADWLHDGRRSLVVADPGELTLRHATLASPIPGAVDTLELRQPTRGNSVASAVADLDLDGIDDAICVSRDSSLFTVMLARCATLGPAVPLVTPGSGWTAAGTAVTDGGNAMGAADVVSDGAGGAYVAWIDSGAVAQARVQHLLPDGRRDPAWSVNGVRAPASSVGVSRASLLADGGTGAWLLWSDANATDVRASRVLRSGRVPQWWALTGAAQRRFAAGAANGFSAFADARRGFVLGWSNAAGEVRSQHWSGVGEAFAPNDSAGAIATNGVASRSEVRTLPAPDDGVWTFWREPSTTPGGDALRAMRLRANGVRANGWPLGGLTFADGAGARHIEDAVSDGAGGAYVVWRDARSGTATIYAQHVDSTGTIGGTANGVRVSDLGAAQSEAQLVLPGDGTALVVFVNDSGDGGNLYAQRLVPSGRASGTFTSGIAICSASGPQRLPRVLADGIGGAFVCWQDGRSATPQTYALRIGANGAAAAPWPPNGARVGAGEGAQTAPRLATLGSGQAVVVWNDARFGAPQPFVARLSPLAPVTDVAPAIATPALALRIAPDPASDRFEARFTLAHATSVQLELLDVSGRIVRRLPRTAFAAGMHTWRIDDAARLAPGVYLARLRAGSETRTARVAIVR